MKQLSEILDKSSQFLEEKNIFNHRLETEIIISDILNINRLELYLDYEKALTEEQFNKIRESLIKRGNRLPLQYITGNVQFLNTNINVNENVLIPRPETEFMVDYIIRQEFSDSCNNYDILDLCTGSGAIAIALKKELPQANVYGSDISEKALEIAQINAKENVVEIIFIESDLFANIKDIKFDFIVSNPPYVSEKEYKCLEQELLFEPRLALVALDNGLYFYDKILESAKNYLKEDGKIYFEIGEKQANEIEKIANKYDYNVIEIINDLNDRNRIAIITQKFEGE
jgi:release factor glutamine methyltransferase